MAARIGIVENQKEWEDLVLSQKPNQFVQSWTWGEFAEKVNRKVHRLGLYEGEGLVGVALIEKRKSRISNYLYCPRGPLFDWENRDHFALFIDEIKRLAKEDSVDYVRMDPALSEDSPKLAWFRDSGFTEAATHMQPVVQWVLDVRVPKEEIMAGMRKQTRYYVRRAERDGVKVEKSLDPGDIEIFHQQLVETAERQKFQAHLSLSYLKTQFETFAKQNQVALFKAMYKGECLATAIIFFYGDTASYVHGASTLKYPKVPASYLIQWEAIKEAKSRGCELYDFFGIARDDNPKNPYRGITTFKKGFGGEERRLIMPQDLGISFKYKIVRTGEKVRRIIRPV